MIPYLYENWILFTLNLTVQAKVDFLANAEIEGSNFKNKKSHIKKFFIFELFVNFSTDSDSSAINFFRTGSKHAYTKIIKSHLCTKKIIFWSEFVKFFA